MEWYIGYEGKITGPLNEAQAKLEARENSKALAWRPGSSGWVPVAGIPELTDKTEVSVPPFPGGINSAGTDFRIYGQDMQFVEIELDSGESTIAKVGTLIYKDSTVTMDTVLGDGSDRTDKGILGKLLGTGRKVLTGKSFFITRFTQSTPGKGRVAFGTPFPGIIVPLSLSMLGGSVFCRRNNLLCAGKGVSIGLYFRKKIPAGFFGRDAFIMHKLEGDGTVFIHAGGTVAKKELAEGENLDVAADCIAAFGPEVGFDTEKTGNMKNIFLRGKGIHLVRLRGPGKVWLQSLPLSRLAGRILKTAAQNGGRQKGFQEKQ